MRPLLSEMEAGSLIKVVLSENDTAYTIRQSFIGLKNTGDRLAKLEISGASLAEQH